jgi:hypothetical protein
MSSGLREKNHAVRDKSETRPEKNIRLRWSRGEETEGGACYEHSAPLEPVRDYTTTAAEPREKYLSLGADGESETHHTAGSGAARGVGQLFRTFYLTV